MGRNARHLLTEKKIANAAAGPLLADGGGLYYKPTAKGTGSFLYRYTSPTRRSGATGQRRDMGLGGYPLLTLADARQKAAEAAAVVAKGIDPLDAKEAPAASPAGRTFAGVMEITLAKKQGELSNKKHAAQWRSTLEEYAAKLLPMPVESIRAQHVADVLSPIWLTKMETAKRVRGRIEAVLATASALGIDHREPASLKKLQAILPKQKPVIVHHEALHLDKAQAAFRHILAAARKQPASAAGALAIIILTACRQGEIRHLQIGDIDLKAGVAVIPPDRMKARKAHRVALSPLASDLLTAAIGSRRAGLVFPSSTGRPLSDMATGAVLRRLKIDGTTHGWRSVFSTWARNIERVPRDVAEDALAHEYKNKVEAAYLRTDLLEDRVAVMAAWETWLTAEPTAEAPNNGQ